MPIVFISPGSFMMGSPPDEIGHDSDEKQVEVTLSQPFWLAKTEVTVAQWQAVMGSDELSMKARSSKSGQFPVGCVSWEDAQAFNAKLNDRQILPQGWKFALPTEAQWEYACRAGEKGPYSGGSLDEVGWHSGNSEFDFGVYRDHEAHEVGLKKPNAWGLHDMHGNVSEWCADWVWPGTPRGGLDPKGAASGHYRVHRGGYYRSRNADCRAAACARDDPSNADFTLGFRPAIVKAQ
jgi:formylglycine-generating enzyme required for sulfatase activity